MTVQIPLLTLNKLPKKAIFYIATGSKHLDESFLSCKLSRRWSAGIPICVVTDLVDEARSSGLFDLVLPHPQPVYSYRDKISPLPKLPLATGLFLDSDAFLTYTVADIFELSEHCHIAASPSPVSHPPGWSDHSVPQIFGELNTGVILFKFNRKVRNLCRSWLCLYDQLLTTHNQSWDQASFRSVLWEYIKNRKLKFLALPPEANLRTPKPWIASRGINVYAVHGRFDFGEVDIFEEYLNSNIDKFRTFAEWKKLSPNSTIFPRFDNPSDE